MLTDVRIYTTNSTARYKSSPEVLPRTDLTLLGPENRDAPAILV